MNIINLTVENYTLRRGDGSELVLPPASVPASVNRVPDSWATPIDGVLTVKHAIDGDVINLPEPADDTVYLVSQDVWNHVTDRPDVVTPGLTALDGAVFDSYGRLLAVTKLILQA